MMTIDRFYNNGLCLDIHAINGVRSDDIVSFFIRKGEIAKLNLSVNGNGELMNGHIKVTYLARTTKNLNEFVIRKIDKVSVVTPSIAQDFDSEEWKVEFKPEELTLLETDVILNGIGNNEYENDGSPVWSWSIQPNCKIVTAKQISGVIGSLVKKGLVICAEWESGWTKNPDDSTVELTEKGKKILAELRNNV